MVALAKEFTLSQDKLTAAVRQRYRVHPQTQINLLPIELESIDRMMHGSISVPEGWDDFGLSFVSDSGEDLGMFDLSEGSSTYLYDQHEDIFSEQEVEDIRAGNTQPGQTDQKVIFVKDDEDPNKIHFYATFDSLGEVEVGIHLGASLEKMGTATHEMTEQETMSALIDKLDERLNTLEIPGPVDPPVDWDRDGTYDPGPGGDTDTSILLAQQPGTMNAPGSFVEDALEDDPANLVLLINDDADGGSGADNGDTTIHPSDDDVSKFTLRRPAGLSENVGTLTLTVSNPSAVRVFNKDGTAELINYTVDLSNPTGDLAGLATGDVPVFIEGLASASDVTLTLTYNDGQSNVESDIVHFNIQSQQTAFYQLSMPETHVVTHNGMKTTYLRYYTPGGGVTNIATHSLVAIGAVENRNYVTKTFARVWGDLKTVSELTLQTGGVVLDMIGPVIEGLIDGAWDGASDDWQMLTEIPGVIGSATSTMSAQLDMLLEDFEGRSGEITNAAFEIVAELNLESLDDLEASAGLILDNCLDSLYATSERNVSWTFVNLSPGDNPTIAYCFGYGLGYGLEQTILLGGIAKRAGITFKTLMTSARGGTIGLSAIAKVSSFKARALRFASVYTRSKDEMRAIRRMVDRVARKTTGNSTAGHIIVEKLETLDDAQINLKTICDDVAKYGDDAGTYPHLKDNFDWNNHGYRAFTRLAELIEILGDQTTEKAIKGFIQSYGRMIDGNTTDRFDDFVQLLGGGTTTASKQAIKETLEEIIDNPQFFDGKPAYFLKNVDQVHPSGYHYTSNESLKDFIVNNGNLPTHGNGGWYSTFEEITDSSTAVSKLQLDPNINVAKYRVKFATTPVKDKVRVPYGRNESKQFLEPKTRDVTDFGGSGGSTQVRIDSEITVQEIWDISVTPAVQIY